MRREANICFITPTKPAIVAARHQNAAGITYEQEDPILVPNWRDSAELAKALRAAIERFSFKDRNLRDLKRTEWPSFRASGFRSVKEFESVCLCVWIRAVNDAELFYEAEAKPIGEDDIMLKVTLNRNGSDEEIGRCLIRLFDLCTKWPALNT